MSRKALGPVEEYVRMSFDGPGPEYPYGELVERNLGEDSVELPEFDLAIQKADVFE